MSERNFNRHSLHSSHWKVCKLISFQKLYVELGSEAVSLLEKCSHLKVPTSFKHIYHPLKCVPIRGVLSSGLLSKEQFCYLKGKALNVLADHDPEAESLLASAIKRDPGLADAWVSLGESYWKKGNIQQAHDCFTSSLNHVGT